MTDDPDPRSGRARLEQRPGTAKNAIPRRDGDQPHAGEIFAAASHAVPEVLAALGSDEADGLSERAVRERAERYGPNAVSSHRARFLPALWHQLRSPLLGLLLAAALASFLVGERGGAVIITIIVAMSVGLGFVNEYRAEKAAESLHAQISHQAVVVRDGRPASVEVTTLVPGDVVRLQLGEVVPADVRLLEVNGLECDEAMMTGESQAVAKGTEAVPAGTALGDLTCCALMGTIVRAGNGRGVVVAIGADAQFGAIAAGLGAHQLDTAFQVGLRRFSMLLVYVAAALTSLIFVANLVLQRPFLDALLFSLAIAVGITPQLLPAVVATSLAAGSKRMLRRKVLVKRLVCIEDLGDVDTLFTDKTGTLTLGRITYARAVPAGAARPDDVLRAGLLCTESLSTDGAGVGGNPLDEALTGSPAVAHLRSGLIGTTRLELLPFDHDRRMVSVLVREGGATTLVTKGAPETVLDRCVEVPETARAAMTREFEAGNRVVAVATRPATGDRLHPADESGLHLQGFLVFLDPPKPGAAEALRRLGALGITVKVVTGDNPSVAAKVCHDLGLSGDAVLTGSDLDAVSDVDLPALVDATTVFARVSPRAQGPHRPGPPQHRRRRDPAGEGPRGPRRRNHRGTTDLREHHQVRADGDLEQLRQHVLGGRGLSLPAVPADAALPDPAQQPPLRHRPAGHPDRQRGRGAAAQAIALGHRLHPALHVHLRTAQLGVRRRDLRGDAGRVPRERAAVPLRVVRRVPGHPDAGHLRDPHPPGALPPQPPQPPDHPRGPRRRCGRRDPAGDTAGSDPRLRPLAGRVLRGAGGDGAGLPAPDRDRQELVLPGCPCSGPPVGHSGGSDESHVGNRAGQRALEIAGTRGGRDQHDTERQRAAGPPREDTCSRDGESEGDAVRRLAYSFTSSPKRSGVDVALEANHRVGNL